ncbi:MAG: cell division protein FtsX [Rickettsiales bacterium]
MMHWFKTLIATDIPFARDDAHRLLPSMVACLIGFAALLLAVAMCLTDALSAQARDVAGVLQIEVPHARAADKSFMDSVANEIKRARGVEEVTLLSEATMEGLLKPWLGDDFALADLPVPAMFDVKTAVKNNATIVDVAALGTALAKLDRGIKVEDRGPWVQHLVRASTLLQALVLLVAALLIACVVGMIVLVAKTNLKLHFKTVSLLHMFGATDDYILRQFQWNSAWLAGRGALVGVMFAVLVFATAVILSVRWHSPVLPVISVGFAHAILFLTLPLFTAMIAFVATRLTVQSMLQHMH